MSTEVHPMGVKVILLSVPVDCMCHWHLAILGVLGVGSLVY